MSSISVNLVRGSVPGSAAARLRVRWDRMALLAALLALALLTGAWLALRATGPATAGTPRGDGAVVEQQPALVQHTIAAGDTLWALAAAVDPGADPRPMVDRIMQLNDLASAEVAVGTVVLVPARP